MKKIGRFSFLSKMPKMCLKTPKSEHKKVDFWWTTFFCRFPSSGAGCELVRSKIAFTVFGGRRGRGSQGGSLDVICPLSRAHTPEANLQL